MPAPDAYVVGPTSVANNAFLALQPGAGSEVIVHNINYGGAVEVYFYDGTNSILVDSDASAGSMTQRFLHCTNAKYYRVKNVSGGSIFIAADGMTAK